MTFPDNFASTISTTYEIKASCTNCGTKQNIEVERGKTFNEKMYPCRNCGCHELIKRLA